MEDTIRVVQKYGLPADLQAQVEASAPGVEVIDCHGDEEAAAGELPRADVLFGPVTAEELENAPRLRLVQVISQGVEGLPLEAIGAHGTALANGRSIWSPVMAEFIVGAALAFYRDFFGLWELKKRRIWRESLEPYDSLREKTVLFVGTGDIAAYTVELLKPFACRILGFNRTGRRPPGYAEAVNESGGLHRLLAQSDIVVNSLPNTPKTYHLMGPEEFRRMPREALFINVGRGRTVDEPALVAALRSGSIQGAALDVFEQEPLPQDSPLWTMDNVFICPHRSGIGGDHLKRAAGVLSDNIARLRKGQPLINLVDTDEKY